MPRSRYICGRFALARVRLKSGYYSSRLACVASGCSFLYDRTLRFISGRVISQLRELGLKAKKVVSMVGKHRGRFALKGERELIALAAHGATASEIALRFKTNVKTIEQKARALGISIKKRPVAIGRKAEKMERGRAWTPEEDAILRRGALAGRTAGAIAKQLGRTVGAVRARAYSLEIILGRLPLTTGEIALCHHALAAWERYFGEGLVEQLSAIPKP